MAGNEFNDEMPDCPLCMEPFGLDDINFFPCVCRYQVCRFCWHRIRTDENGLCPHCREPYTENPAEYTPPTQEQILKLKSEKRQKSTEKKQKLMESRKNLADVRVIQKNLVFVVGLSPRLADPETLRKNEYFGKYGRIFKVVINNHTVYNGTQGPSVSAYVTFYRDEDALKAISAVNNAYIDGRYLKASFGTTKYCTTFLRGSQCTKPDCMYLHALGDNEASFTKEDMHMGKHQMYEQSALAAANLDPKEQIAESTVMGSTVSGGGAKKGPVVSKGTHVVEGSEGSALPSTASWASSVPKPADPPVNHVPHLKSHTKTNKQRSTQNHSPKSHTVSSSPKSSLHKQSLKQKHKEIESGSPSPNSIALERTSSAGSRPPRRTDSTSSRDSSSKPGTPSLSPKSTLSKSMSSGSLNQDSSFDSPESISGPPQLLESDYVEPLSVGEPVLELDCTDIVDEGRDLEETVETVEEPVVGMPEVKPVIQPKLVSVLEQELAMEAEKINLENSQVSFPQPTTTTTTVGDGGVYAVSLPETEVKVVRGGQAVRTRTASEKSDVLDVLSGLGSTGSDHFGSLGVSWNTQVPSTLVGSNTDTASEEKKPVTTQHEDDLGFDPWDVSQQGLADLLETEAEEQKRPQKTVSKPAPLSNGVGEHGQSAFMASSALPSRSSGVSKGRDPWQDELKALFPDVNVSFGSPGFPSTATKAKTNKSTTSLHQAVNAMHTTTAYHPTQLANALNYSYQPLQSTTQPVTTGISSSAFSTQVSGSGFPVRGFPASSTKVVSNDCGLPGSGRGLTSLDWPSFGDVGTSIDGKNGKETESKDTTTHTLPVSAPSLTPHTTYTSSLPSPPPGFVAKPQQAFATTTSTSTIRPTVTKVATPTSVAGAVVGGALPGGTLSSSVNHALWASSQMQGKGHVVPSHLLQSWNNFLNFSALTPAQQQQLARSSQNYQHLVAQQYLLMQSYLMRGYPMLQAQAQAQAQIQASIRAQLQQHALRQQQQQAGMAAATLSGTTASVPSSSALPKSAPKSDATSKPTPTSVVSTISSAKEGTVSTTVQASTTAHSATAASTKGAAQNSKPSNQTGSTKTAKHGPTNSSSSKNHYHHTSSKNKTSSSGSKQAKSTSSGSSRSRHKSTGK